jgi:RNA-directed DNA polymerase
MSRHPPRTRLATGLASAFLSGPWTPVEMAQRGGVALGHRYRWLRPLATEAVAAYSRPPLDRPRELAAWIGTNDIFQRAWARARWNNKPAVRQRLPFEAAMGAMRWPVPSFPRVGDLAEFLSLEPSRLAWIADRRSMERSVDDERLRHYRYEWVAKTGGGVRLLEAPKHRLRETQRLLLRDVLDWIPAHPAAHGFVPGRSVLSFVEPHVGAEVVVKLDLEDFFSSVWAGRVFGVFHTAGYPQDVAHVLTALATNVVPRAVWRGAPRPAPGEYFDRHYRLGRRLATPHLPQGAPTSPALANLCAHGLDRRLAGMAASFGMVYSRYADDLALSGAVSGATVNRVIGLAGDIVRDEGFVVNELKTRAVTRSQRQRLAGVVINQRPNLVRAEYDVLRAILHNAAHDGIDSQNRAGRPQFAAHLAGRAGWATHLNPDRRTRLDLLLAAATSES